jgi:hypothetical protein
MERNKMAESMKELVRSLIADELASTIREVIREMGGNGPAVLPANRNQAAEPEALREPQQRRSRARRPAPAVGYHAGAGVDGRTVKRIAADLPDNPATVLQDVVKHPGSTNREIAQRMVVEHDWSVESAKKAVESALYQLRVHDAGWNTLKLDDNRQAKKALVVSRELE